jgi:hypothetical protein
VKKSGYSNQQLVQKSTYRELPAERARIHVGYVINHSDKVYGCGSAIERPRKFWMQMITYRNDALVVNDYYSIDTIQLLNIQ